MPKRLSTELEREVRRLAARGHGLREIGRIVERSRHAVSNVLVREPRAPAVTDWNPSAARLSAQDREEIRAGLDRQESFTAIARTMGRAVSTVTREVAANGGRDSYRAWEAHLAAGERARRPKAPKLAAAGWPPRSLSGWRSGGHRRRSPPGCGSSSRTIR